MSVGTEQGAEVLAEYGKLQSPFMLVEILKPFLSTHGAIQLPTPNQGHLAGAIYIWASWLSSSSANGDNFGLRQAL